MIKNQLYHYLLVLHIMFSMPSCTDLDETVYD